MPHWLSFVVAAFVAVFGAFRLWMGLMPKQRYAARQGHGAFYRVPQRSHMFIGGLFLLMAIWMVLSSLGHDPLR
jgi:hypothetical protein